MAPSAGVTGEAAGVTTEVAGVRKIFRVTTDPSRCPA